MDASGAGAMAAARGARGAVGALGQLGPDKDGVRRRGAVLVGRPTPATDYAITLSLSANSGYRLAARVPSGNTVFYVWQYAPWV